MTRVGRVFEEMLLGFVKGETLKFKSVPVHCGIIGNEITASNLTRVNYENVFKKK